MNLRKLFLTFFGTGESPIYPELVTMTSALVFGAAIIYTIGSETLFMLILAVSVMGIFETNKYLNDSELSGAKGRTDSHIVIDKVAGVWLAILIPYSSVQSVNIPYISEAAIALGFASFYLFDSWKPSTIGWIRKNVSGGLGIIGSSILSGFAGGFLALAVMMGAGKFLK